MGADGEIVVQVMNSHDGHMSVPLQIVKREVLDKEIEQSSQ